MNDALDRDQLARLVAADIAPGSYVNLGIGQPTKVSDHLTAEQGVTPAHGERHAGHGPRRGGGRGRR